MKAEQAADENHRNHVDDFVSEQPADGAKQPLQSVRRDGDEECERNYFAI